MGWWSAYFLAKLVLYGMGYLDFNPWLNLAFAVFTALPPRNARQRLTKNLLAVPMGVMLLYHDSWLPPFVQAAAQLQNLRAFSPEYLWELAGRLISWKLLLELAAMLALYSLVSRKLRMSTFAFLGIVGVMVAPHVKVWPGASPAQAAAAPARVALATAPINLSPDALNTRLRQFYAAQQKIRVRFPRGAAEDAPFDILILHVCSLAWDDLRALRLAPDTLLGHFDVVLTHFNSAASYSGPAAIRLLRGCCPGVVLQWRRQTTTIMHIAEEVAEMSVVIHEPMWLEARALQAVHHEATLIGRIVELTFRCLAASTAQQADRGGAAVAGG